MDSRDAGVASRKIVLFDRMNENPEEIARKIVRSKAARVVLPSYDHLRVAAGQGTAALELLDEQPDRTARILWH